MEDAMLLLAKTLAMQLKVQPIMQPKAEKSVAEGRFSGISCNRSKSYIPPTQSQSIGCADFDRTPEHFRQLVDQLVLLERQTNRPIPDELERSFNLACKALDPEAAHLAAVEIRNRLKAQLDAAAGAP